VLETLCAILIGWIDFEHEMSVELI